MGQRQEVDARGRAPRDAPLLLVDGEVRGFWEVDVDAGEGVVAPFAPLPKARRAAVDEAGAALVRFLLDEIGHARSFSLDTDDEVRKRAAAVRALARRAS